MQDEYINTLIYQYINRLIDSPIEKVIVCNTIDIPKEKQFNKLEIISVAHVFAEAIRHVTEGTSLSAMFINDK